MVLTAFAVGGFVVGLNSRPPAFLSAEIATGLGAVRPVEGRLTGAFRYVPFKNREVDLQALEFTERKIRRARATTAPIELLASEALAALLAQDFQAAIDRLQAASLLEPGPDRLSDLAAAYLARAKAADRPLDLLLALDAAVRARRLRPELPEASFNLALAAQYLGLRSTAREAWHSFLEMEPSSAWSEEARQHLMILEAPTRSERWERNRSRLEAAASRGDFSAVRRIVSEHRQAARLLAQEELLAAWGTSALRGDNGAAATALGAARAIGAALAELSGEQTVAEAVVAVDKAHVVSTLDLQRLAEGHRAYAEGAAHYRRLEIAAAADRFTAAHRAFRNTTSEAATAWSAFFLAATQYYSDQPESALGRFQELLDSPVTKRCPALRGRLLWARGLVLKVRVELGESLVALRAAAAQFERIGEEENAGATEWLVSEGLALLNEPEVAWRLRRQALVSLARSPSSVWRTALLLTSANALRTAGLRDSALLVQTECLETARAIGEPDLLTEVLLARSRLLRDLGRTEEADRDAAEARAALPRVADPVLHLRLHNDVQVATASAQLEVDPGAAVATLSESIAYYREVGRRNHLVRASLLRARAFLRLGEEERAVADLLTGIETYEQARNALRSDRRQVSFFEPWQGLFDEMIGIEARRRPKIALSWVERAKAGMLDQLPGDRGGAAGRAPPLALDDVRRALPDGTAMVVYALLEERLLIWVVRSGAELDFRAQDVPRKEIGERIERLRTDLRQPSARRDAQLAAIALYDRLLRPVIGQIPVGSRLVLIPDKELNAVPFAGLIDLETGRYLIEDHPLSLAHSASLYARAIRACATRVAPEARPTMRALAVGDPAINPQRWGVERLSGAAAEAEAVSELYPRAALLADTDATRRRFLEELPASDVVHFAGHAIHRPGPPALSRLLLTPEPNHDSGALSAEELGQVRLDHLKLVVLSACSTAPGSRARGEGVAGLARAFRLAGAPAVLASLWDVDDRATRHLLLTFHRHWLAGDEAASALRTAQLALLQDPDDRLRAPAVWAAFQLVGVAPSNSVNAGGPDL